jgi:hypothetical protein
MTIHGARPHIEPPEFDNELLDTVGRAIAASMWGEAQARTFFKIRTRNIHYGLAVNAARDALVAYHKARGEQA